MGAACRRHDKTARTHAEAVYSTSVYLLDEETGKTQAYIPPEELQGTRSELFVPLPADVPEGTYRLRVGSQCTTNPQPMKAVAYGDCGWTMKVIQKKGR